jgi:hypothetical protein
MDTATIGRAFFFTVIIATVVEELTGYCHAESHHRNQDDQGSPNAGGR